jgi:hypothetical protein
MVDSSTVALIFNRAYTLISGPQGAAISFSSFEIPSTTDFGILTNKSLSGTSLALTVELRNNTVVYKLRVDIIFMVTNGTDYLIYNVFSRSK